MKIYQKNKDNLTIQFDKSNNQMEISEFGDDAIVTINGKSVLGDTSGMTEFKYEDEIEIDDSEYVTLTAEFPYKGFSSNITVVFDGVEYPNIPKVTYDDVGGDITYGAPYKDDASGDFDYSVYPFSVEFGIYAEDNQEVQEVYINTKTNGSHTISITGFYGESPKTEPPIVIGMIDGFNASVLSGTCAELANAALNHSPFLIMVVYEESGDGGSSHDFRIQPNVSFNYSTKGEIECINIDGEYLWYPDDTIEFVG